MIMYEFNVRNEKEFKRFLFSIEGYFNECSDSNGKKIYESSDGGAIICEPYYLEHHFLTRVQLVGFKERSKKLKALKASLEAISKID